MAVKMHILVCGGTGCSASQSHEIVEELNKELVAHDLTDFAKVVITSASTSSAASAGSANSPAASTPAR